MRRKDYIVVRARRGKLFSPLLEGDRQVDSDLYTRSASQNPDFNQPTAIMCRLYTFHGTAARKVECELMVAQNALIAQSKTDERGDRNAHGWGLAAYRNGVPHTEKQPDPAFESEKYRWAAGEIYSTHVLAHVRRATQGRVALENTHPFTWECWAFAHNGHIDRFDQVRPWILERMGPDAAGRIDGDTDSEHVFHLLLAERARRSDEPFLDVLHDTLCELIDRVQNSDDSSTAALNILMTDGNSTWGSRRGRSLWYVERTEVHSCEVCGDIHANVEPGDDYRAIDIASERITETESWLEMPENHVFQVERNVDLTIRPLRAHVRGNVGLGHEEATS